MRQYEPRVTSTQTPIGDQRHRHPGGHAEEAEAGGHAGELGHRGAEVGDEHGEHGEGRHPQAEALADEGRQAFAGDGPHARAHLLGDGQDGGDEQQHPEQAIAVPGAGDGPRGDAAGVVVGVGRDEPRAHDRQEHEQTAAAYAAQGAPGRLLRGGRHRLVEDPRQPLLPG